MSQRTGVGPVPKIPRGLDLALAFVTLLNSGVSWLTWVKVGASERNSYEVFRTAQRFDLEALDPLRFVWFMSPVATLACLLLVAIQMRRPAGLLVLFQSILVAAVGLAVLLVGVESGLGPLLGFASGITGIGLGASALMSRN